jgi:hypothetical protein
LCLVPYAFGPFEYHPKSITKTLAQTWHAMTEFNSANVYSIKRH